MAEKKDDTTEMLKTKAALKEVQVGLSTVIKALQQGKLQKVFLASNCPAKMKADLTHYAALAQVPVEQIAQNNEELGIICKKNFLVSVIGLIR